MKRFVAIIAMVIAVLAVTVTVGNAQQMQYVPRTSAGGAYVPQDVLDRRALIEEVGVKDFVLGRELPATTIIDNSTDQRFEAGSNLTNVNSTVQQGSGGTFTLVPTTDQSSHQSSNPVFQDGSSQVNVGVTGQFGSDGKLIVKTQN